MVQTWRRCSRPAALAGHRAWRPAHAAAVAAAAAQSKHMNTRTIAFSYSCLCNELDKQNRLYNIYLYD